jgi:hypothetical protein
MSIEVMSHGPQRSPSYPEATQVPDDLWDKIGHLTYQIGLLIAGHEPDWQWVAPSVIDELRAMMDPFHEAGVAFRPDFGERGGITTLRRDNPDDPLIAWVDMEMRNLREWDLGDVDPDVVRPIRFVVTLTDDTVTDVKVCVLHGDPPFLDQVSKVHAATAEGSCGPTGGVLNTLAQV